MKHFGSVQKFTTQRNKEIMRIYRHYLKQADFIIRPDILEKVANAPTSRFWVSEERAATVIALMLAGRPIPKMRPNKQEMFNEIYHRFILLRTQFPKRPFNDLVVQVVNSPAPRFYLTPRSLGEIIYLIKKGHYENY